jgi:hypothetical protein
MKSNKLARCQVCDFPNSKPYLDLEEKGSNVDLDW